MIVIIGGVADPHVALVVRHLLAMDVEPYVLDIYNPNSDIIASDLGNQLRVAVGGGGAEFVENPKSVWWRQKPPFVVCNDSAESFFDQRFSLGEWNSVLSHFSEAWSEAFWLNKRADDLRASDKLLQLKIATKCGLKIPYTLFSNKVSEILNFIENQPFKKCIHKSIAPYISPDGKIKYATEICKEDILRIGNAAKVCPSIYQQIISANHEYRITIVGNNIFSAKIYKLNCTPDWRRTTFENVYEKVDIGDDLRQRLLMLHSKLGLVYGAYDLMELNGEFFSWR